MSKSITIAETSLFARQAEAVWDEEERMEFIDFIADNPQAGAIIPDTGGIRKIRWSRQGSGKRGGVRIIYFYYDEDAPLYLLMVYAKAQQENLTPANKRKLAALTSSLRTRHRK